MPVDSPLASWPAALAACVECPYVITPAAAERLAGGAPPQVAPAANVSQRLRALDQELGLRVWPVEGVMVWLADTDAPGLPAAATRRALSLDLGGGALQGAPVPRAVRRRIEEASARAMKWPLAAVDDRCTLEHISEAYRLCTQPAATGEAMEPVPGSAPSAD